MTSPQRIFTFSDDADLSNWMVVDDVVMGGRSDGNFRLSTTGHGHFYGEVSLENNGGFSSVRYRLPELLDLKGREKFVLRVKGDGKSYSLRAKSERGQRHNHGLTFPTSGEWEEIGIPFADMEAAFRGRQLDLPHFDCGPLAELRILIGNKKPQAFDLLIDWIEVR